VYEFTPDRAGTFWYHGHYHEQYADGLIGALIITAPYDSAAAAAGVAEHSVQPIDSDEWVWVLADAYDAPATSLLGAYLSPASGGVEPTPDAITLNGVRPGGGFHVAASRRGPPVRLRLINAGTVSMFTISIDGMPLVLIELDGTAVQPLLLRSVTLAVAQRASVILDWSRLHPNVSASPALWIRVEAAREMYGAFDPAAPHDGLRGTAGGAPLNTSWAGVVWFNDDVGGAPSYTAPPLLPPQGPGDTAARDANLLAASPARGGAVLPATHVIEYNVMFKANASGVNRAYVNGVTTNGPSQLLLGRPELHAAALDGVRAEASAVDGATSGGGVVRILGDAETPFVVPRGAVVDVLINNTDDGEHPFHLHGHTCWVVATSEQPGAEAQYAARGYVLRDVVSVPARGWAKIRFVADNPGAWLLHCHIDWHVRAGLVTTVVEAPEELLGYRLPAAHVANCANYRASAAAASAA
jgi:FtsP/CotA-like multicopper oxidase with cupredoxin domain